MHYRKAALKWDITLSLILSHSSLPPNPNIASGKAGRGVQQYLYNLLILSVPDNSTKY